jgi:hypothetical protein
MAVFQGSEGARVLSQSGFLGVQGLPISSADVIRFLQNPDTFVVMGYEDGVMAGYVVCAKRLMEDQTPELFILQVVGDGGALWVNEGWQKFHEFAAKIGARQIGTMLPVDEAATLARRFGLSPRGVYAVTPVKGRGARN